MFYQMMAALSAGSCELLSSIVQSDVQSEVEAGPIFKRVKSEGWYMDAINKCQNMPGWSYRNILVISILVLVSILLMLRFL